MSAIAANADTPATCPMRIYDRRMVVEVVDVAIAIGPAMGRSTLATAGR